MADDFIPDRDASLGLVFRLNLLWSKTDYAALGGRYDEWNNTLDRIYCNLLYREDIVTDVEEETGKITKVTLSPKDTKVYRYLSLQVAKARKSYKQSHFRVGKGKAKSRWYHAVQKKDIWLRKFMQKLKLYLKETEKRPGSVLFGGFGQKRK